MNKDFSELIEYLDEKFAKIDANLEYLKENKADKKDVQGLMNSIDKLTNSIEIYHQEQVAMKAKMDIHEKWILQLAEKLGLKLEY
jgi:hypothetical protein